MGTAVLICAAIVSARNWPREPPFPCGSVIEDGQKAAIAETSRFRWVVSDGLRGGSVDVDTCIAVKWGDIPSDCFWVLDLTILCSGRIHLIQKMTIAAMTMGDMKVWAQGP
jgi:hypothetical protein